MIFNSQNHIFLINFYNIHQAISFINFIQEIIGILLPQIYF